MVQRSLRFQLIVAFSCFMDITLDDQLFDHKTNLFWINFHVLKGLVFSGLGLFGRTNDDGV
jgi:hypothetical protein